MVNSKKFIAPGRWFTMNYPADWNEFEDEEGTFLFYNPDVWTGNFRISAFKETGKGKKNAAYGMSCVKEELKSNTSASSRLIGNIPCAYSKEMFQEEGEYYTSHLWIAAIGAVAFECSFTVKKGDSITQAEDIIASLTVPDGAIPYPDETIPLRLMEMFLINDALSWTDKQLKASCKQEQKGTEEDIALIQKLVDTNKELFKNADNCRSIALSVCDLLANTIDNVEWATRVAGFEEEPVLLYNQSKVIPVPFYNGLQPVDELYKLLIDSL